jgi:UDP-N-acetylmuramoyl-tripeptide--D-alanyl-D-alanine ligase
MIWDSKRLSEAIGSKVPPNILANQVQFNSADVLPGDLFIALKGEKEGHDGHKYVHDAIARGAAAAIVSHVIDGEQEREKLILVQDTYETLLKLAEYKRNRTGAKVIGITGSVGKTTTKELLGGMLSAYGRTIVSRGNFNNYLGVPINLASMPDDLDYAVIEMGMSSPGEISFLTKLVKPDIAVITGVAAAHLQFFNSMAEIADAKSEIFEGLPLNGIGLVNRDSDYYNRMLSNANKLSITNIKSFGKNSEADSILQEYRLLPNDQVYLAYQVLGQKIELTVDAIPEHLAENIAIVFLVIKLLKNELKIDLIRNKLSEFTMPEGRGKIIHTDRNGKKNTIICDQYNANPTSVKASLKYLQQISADSKVFIFGDMLELGEFATNFHEELVPYIVEAGVSKVILVGKYSSLLSNLFPKKIKTFAFNDVDLLISKIDSIVDDNDFILVKGSKGIKLQKIIDRYTRFI